MEDQREVAGAPVGPAATRRRSETYVARRRPAALAFGLKSLAIRVYQAGTETLGHLVTAAAAGATWAVCLPFGGFAPAFGAASAVYAVQLTVRTSVLDGAKRTVLMGISVLLSVLILRTVGLSDVAVMALVFVSLGVGQLLRLGVSGSAPDPGHGQSILALGTSVSTDQLLNRVWATFIGAVIGAAASYVAYPAIHRAQAADDARGARAVDRRIALEMSAGVERSPPATETELWLARSPGAGRGSGSRAHSSTRPGLPPSRPFRVAGPARLTCRRSLQPSRTRSPRCEDRRAPSSTTGPTALHGFPPASRRYSPGRPAAYRVRAEALESDAPNLDAALDAVRQARLQSLRSLRRVDETGAWVLSGAILTDVDRMVRQLEGGSPALGAPSGAPRRPAARWRF